MVGAAYLPDGRAELNVQKKLERFESGKLISLERRLQYVEIHQRCFRADLFDGFERVHLSETTPKSCCDRRDVRMTVVTLDVSFYFA